MRISSGGSLRKHIRPVVMVLLHTSVEIFLRPGMLLIAMVRIERLLLARIRRLVAVFVIVPVVRFHSRGPCRPLWVDFPRCRDDGITPSPF